MLDLRHKILNKNYSLKRGVKGIVLLLFFFTLCSFIVIEKAENSNDSIQDKKAFCGLVNEHIGWWVYGEGQHIFKDEETLEEYDLVFPEENMEELVELYLSVCEMEYFPMECAMKGAVNEGIFYVVSFEILYIQGCGE
tara:strand:- start:48 stop:461 length:414 start_codon:yes stop_codon:yes gene_type:complete